MAEERRSEKQRREPKGFTPKTSGLASEYAREQGWDTNEEQRARTPMEKQPYDGGRDYDYGAQVFGDTAADTSGTRPGKQRHRTEGKKKSTGKRAA
jgi:hypothetical protein